MYPLRIEPQPSLILLQALGADSLGNVALIQEKLAILIIITFYKVFYNFTIC